MIDEWVVLCIVFQLQANHSNVTLQDVKLNEGDFPKDVPSTVFQHMVNMTVLVTHLVVEFSKKLPGFLDLEKDDQIILLKVDL